MFKSIVFFCLSVLLLSGCTMPRLIVLNDPLDAEQHNDLGVAYEHRGDYDLALREYDRAAELAKSWARPLINRGNVQAGMAEWRKAERSYRQALRREPGHAEAMNNLAWVLLQAGKSDQALQWAEKAVAVEPGEPTFFDTLADIHLSRGEPAAALASIDMGLALSPPPELRRALEEKRSAAMRQDE
jgi:tetratricopeptide (TPR) repeat protein